MCLRLLIAFLVVLLAACSEQGEPDRSIEYYTANPDERDAKLAECKALTPAEVQVIKNCTFARAALKESMKKGYTDRGAPVEVTPLPKL